MPDIREAAKAAQVVELAQLLCEILGGMSGDGRAMVSYNLRTLRAVDNCPDTKLYVAIANVVEGKVR